MNICVQLILVGACVAMSLDTVELGHDAHTQPDFSRYYESVEVTVKPDVPEYVLPLDFSTVQNYDQVNQALIREDEDGRASLRENGVAVVSWGKEDDILAPFKTLRRHGIPAFVASDVLLHLYRIQFLESLKEIEEGTLIDLLHSLSAEYLELSSEQYSSYTGDLKEAARRNTAFFSVALRLLDPHAEVPDFVSNEVNAEIEKIAAHKGLGMSDIFKYQEDYSQYVPRGHYTRSERLQRYFRAMMWYGRMTFVLKPKLVRPHDARIQTLQASLIAAFSETIRVEGQTARRVWDRIYGVTAFYVGLADDLTIHDYIGSMRQVLGSNFDTARLTDEDCLFELKRALALTPSPKIYGGTGAIGILPTELTAEKLDEILDDTKGLRFMGQRFVPDSYMFSELVAPSVGELSGEPSFTSVFSMGVWIRGFPRGLDVMRILGSQRAGEILAAHGDDKYERYYDQIEKLEQEFKEFSTEEWNWNLYWSWLYVLKSLLRESPEGYPTFMHTEAWMDKQLTTALASWTGLRHATILYAKQSVTPMITAAPPPQILKGYVEPVPEVYARLLALAEMTKRGLLSMDLLSEATAQRLKPLTDVLRMLIAISRKELENVELSDEEYDFIRNIDRALEAVVRGVEVQTIRTTFVVDVHTDLNTKLALEEGSGYVNLVIVAVREPDGTMMLKAGPVLSYYEFKQPIADRLTDEKWIELLRGERAPDEGW